MYLFADTLVGDRTRSSVMAALAVKNEKNQTKQKENNNFLS
jgi:hypothetical protein